MSTHPKLRLVFMGTPDFSAVILERLLDWPGCEVPAVYTQPDRPAGRGKKLHASPVKELALRHGVEVRQPLNFKSQADVTALAALDPDFLVVAAYGLILPQAVLDIPKLAPVNVHASLLPKYRGAAPIQRVVMNGDAETGIALMRMEAGLDTGPVYAERAIPIGQNATAGEVHDELALLGGEMLLECLPGIAAGALRAAPQNDALATYAPKLSKADGRIDFNRPAREVHNHVRGVSPWPGAWCELRREGGEKDDLVRVRVCPGGVAADDLFPEGAGETPGTVLGATEDGLAVRCADGVYLIPKLCPADSKMMGALEFACGYLNHVEACRVIGLDDEE